MAAIYRPVGNGCCRHTRATVRVEADKPGTRRNGPSLHQRSHIDRPAASLVFDRPNVLNAFRNEATDECVATFQELGDDQRVQAILVRAQAAARSLPGSIRRARHVHTVEHVRRHMEQQFDFIAFGIAGTIALVHGFCMPCIRSGWPAISQLDARFGEPGSLRHRNCRHAVAMRRCCPSTPRRCC